MTQFKEILEKERNRESSGDFNSIVFVQEGSFYRAYEWSAWLKGSLKNDLKTGGVGDGGFHRMSEVLSLIMSCPIEQKSLMECMSFGESVGIN